MCVCYFFFFSSRRRHTRLQGDWSSDVCSSDLYVRSVFRKLGEVSFEEIEAAYQSMEDEGRAALAQSGIDRKSTRLNSSHLVISYAVFCLKKNKKERREEQRYSEILMSHEYCCS